MQTFRELLPDNGKDFFKLYIKQYWHFQSYYKIILYTFLVFTFTNNKFRESYSVRKFSDFISDKSEIFRGFL